MSCNKFRILILVLPVESIEALPETTTSIIVAIIIGLIFGAMAYFLDYILLALYGIMFMIGELVWGFFDTPAGPLIMLIFGIIVLIIGIGTFIRFLNKYPLPTKEALSGC